MPASSVDRKDSMVILSVLWSYAVTADTSSVISSKVETSNVDSAVKLGLSRPIQTGMCSCHSWEFNLALSFVSLVLWSLLLAALSSLAVKRNEHERISRERHQYQARKEFVLQSIRIKVRIVKSATFELRFFLLSLDVCGGQRICLKGTAEVSAVALQVPVTLGCCSICLEDFQDGDEICESQYCRHQFHMNGCMDEWLLRHDECPVCRRDYVQSDRHSIYQQPKSRNRYVEPLAMNSDGWGARNDGRYPDERWRFREAGLTAMSEFPPWFW